MPIDWRRVDASQELAREKLKEIRQKTGCTQEEFARKIGLGWRAYSALERGETRVRRLHLNAALFVAQDIEEPDK